MAQNIAKEGSALSTINEFPKNINKIVITGFEEFVKFVENLKPDGPTVILYFSGQKQSDGRSWCPDCVLAEPVVEAYLKEVKEEVTFAYVDVGDRDYWKNPQCPFRTDKRTKLMVIPTIIKWRCVKRLEGSQCNKRELLQMLFDDED